MTESTTEAELVEMEHLGILTDLERCLIAEVRRLRVVADAVEKSAAHCAKSPLARNCTVHELLKRLGEKP